MVAGARHQILLLGGGPGELPGLGAGQGAQVTHVPVPGAALGKPGGGRDLVRGEGRVLRAAVVGELACVPGLQGGVATRHGTGEGCGSVLENIMI